MIELKKDALEFRFPEVHKDAVLRIELQRTLRIPDDGKTYSLPPGLGRFPLRHVDDFAERVPSTWLKRGGAMLPMYQSEALWLNFSSEYPFAVKVATGKINAVTGDAWNDGLHRRPQDYLSIPQQPWLDGYCVEKGMIRQFVAMPLGSGYTAEEQLTGAADHGGVQIVAYPIKAEVWERMKKRQTRRMMAPQVCSAVYECMDMDMGLAPGGRMRQEIYDDKHKLADWETSHSSRCFLHLANALVWRSVTGEEPPRTPATAAEYTRRGLPWFDLYAGDQTAVEGSALLKKLKSVVEMGKSKGEKPLPENESVEPGNVVQLRKGLTRDQVREGAF